MELLLGKVFLRSENVHIDLLDIRTDTCKSSRTACRKTMKDGVHIHCHAFSRLCSYSLVFLSLWFSCHCCCSFLSSSIEPGGPQAQFLRCHGNWCDCLPEVLVGQKFRDIFVKRDMMLQRNYSWTWKSYSSLGDGSLITGRENPGNEWWRCSSL